MRHRNTLKSVRRGFALCAGVLLAASLGTIASGGGAGVAATTEPSASEPAEPPETASITIAADSFLLGTLAWVADDQGYFESRALDVDVAMFGTGIEAIQGVIARQADLGHALDFAVLNLVAAADENMSIVGAIAEPAPGFHSLAVRNDITAPEDLVGTTIGYVEGTSEHFVTIRYLEQHGISLDDVELVPLPGLFELVGALKTNDIQAAWTWLDGTAQVAEDDNLAILGDDSEVLDTVAIYLIAATDWANENQDVIERVLQAYDEASAFTVEDVDAAAAIVAEGTGGDAEAFAAALPRQNFKVELTQEMLDSLDSIAQFLIESGVLAEDFDVREFLELSAMEAAVPGSISADLG